jgi:hypothetical protein
MCRADLQRLYVREGLSLVEVARHLDVNVDLVKRNLDRLGIPRRDRCAPLDRTVLEQLYGWKGWGSGRWRLGSVSRLQRSRATSSATAFRSVALAGRPTPDGAPSSATAGGTDAAATGGRSVGLSVSVVVLAARRLAVSCVPPAWSIGSLTGL